MTKTFLLKDTVKRRAFLFASGRNAVNHSQGRITPTSHYQGRSSTFEMDYQGLIGELFLAETYPQLKPAQDYLVMTTDTKHPDFLYKGLGVEVKTSVWRTTYTSFLVNKLRHDLKGNVSKIFVACALNDVAEKAHTISVLGWVMTEGIAKFPVKHAKYEDAYEVPLSNFNDIDLLWEAHFHDDEPETTTASVAAFAKSASANRYGSPARKAADSQRSQSLQTPGRNGSSSDRGSA